MANANAHVPKPEWLKIKLGSNLTYQETKGVLRGHHLNTICTGGRCPNQGECWSRGTATFMIGGAVCTRSCKFCNTPTGKPLPLNPEEPMNVALSVQALELKHAVITSVDRDDLPDYGAAHWVKTIQAVKAVNPQVTCEVLIPDFRGNLGLVDSIIAAAPELISHNLETVERLTPAVRSVATYRTSLAVLEHIARSPIPAKTGIMLGLGETPQEILRTMDDALGAGVQVLTIGQYLQPSRKQLPVVEYIHPDTFAEYKEIGLKKGFRVVESGPLVRSSYHAERHILRPQEPADLPPCSKATNQYR